MTIYQTIVDVIKNEVDKGNRSFIIFPFGEIGMYTKQILNMGFNINEVCIIDNGLCEVNSKVKPIEYLKFLKVDDYKVLFCTLNLNIKENLKKEILKYCKEENVVDLFRINSKEIIKTKCGKYSYGPLCAHHLVESIGAFSSTAHGSDVVPNHAMSYVSTHPFIYQDESCNEIYDHYEIYKNEKWFFPGVNPKGEVPKFKKINIGNDVWIGKNVIITNGANIGNGVIAAAGAVITKDVPDYAVVMGVPARIVRYRYTPEQIEKLNKIAWWDWSDEKIRECYDDFFLDIEEFLSKHYT